jgi:hypothetical protein
MRLPRADSKAIPLGRILLMVDFPKDRVKQWKQLILEHHSEGEIGVTALYRT